MPEQRLGEEVAADGGDAIGEAIRPAGKVLRILDDRIDLGALVEQAIAFFRHQRRFGRLTGCRWLADDIEATLYLLHPGGERIGGRTHLGKDLLGLGAQFRQTRIVACILLHGCTEGVELLPDGAQFLAHLRIDRIYRNVHRKILCGRWSSKHGAAAEHRKDYRSAR